MKKLITPTGCVYAFVGAAVVTVVYFDKENPITLHQDSTAVVAQAHSETQTVQSNGVEYSSIVKSFAPNWRDTSEQISTDLELMQWQKKAQDIMMEVDLMPLQLKSRNIDSDKNTSQQQKLQQLKQKLRKLESISEVSYDEI